MEEITNNKNTMDKQPLVSIIVITYNSSKYVLETLESAKAQTYQNIELIISDDCSTDNTVEICRQWLEENKERFVRTKLITVEKNSGIPANCNRGVRASKGEWVKLIAGDDALKKKCINDNISIVLSNNKISILQTNVDYYNDNFKSSNFIKTSSVETNPFFTKTNNADDQYRMIIYGNKVIAPSIFIKRDVINNVGGYDEDIPLMEDLSFWSKITKNGYRISYNNAVTVNYRLHSQSATKGEFNIMSISYAKGLLIYNKKYKKNNVNNLHYNAYNLGLYLIIFQNKANTLINNVFVNKVFSKLSSMVMKLGAPKI